AVQAGRVEQAWFHPETASATKRIVVALLWLLALVVAYPYMPGSGSDVFKGISVFAGVVLSLGSSGIVSQGMSGLVLMYARALKPGDYVRVGDTEGTVTALGLLSTKIRTTKREQVTVPNAVMIGAGIKNYSRLAVEGDGVIIYTSVTIGYNVPWRQVEAMLLIAAQRTDGLLDTPKPFVLKTGLSDFYVEYQLNAHLAAADCRIPVLSALHGHVVDVFNEHEVQILSPHYMADPPTPAVVPRSRWFASPARATATDGSRGEAHGRANGQPVARAPLHAED
ncbi:MAG: mechanosensitive ion channel family protein, partial [Candidatus Eremiobacteraeota bacterium]|nr:mechanosensitive ion channel family protein [Candidatus Eremiobacteraeota bacterium]